MTEKKSFKDEFEAFQSTYRADSERAKVRYRSISALVDGSDPAVAEGGSSPAT